MPNSNLKVSFSGGADYPEELDRGERAIFIVDGFVKERGERETASAGVQEFAKIRTGTVVRLSGAEANQWRERIAEVQHERDGGTQVSIDEALSGDEDGDLEDDEDPLA